MTETTRDCYIEAPTEYQPAVGERSVFLAGGITGCPDWQAEARERIHDRMPEAVVINPRRSVFDPSSDEALQVEWEHRHLHLVDVVLFWFPDASSDQPIAMYELGAALHRGASVAVGAEQAWHRYRNLAAQVRLADRNAEIHTGLDDLARAAVALLSHPGRLSHAANQGLMAARRIAFAAIAREARTPRHPRRRRHLRAPARRQQPGDHRRLHCRGHLPVRHPPARDRGARPQRADRRRRA